MIRLRAIEKYYSTGFVNTYVLRHIDLDVQEGEFLSIMGPSGSGKSTLLNYGARFLLAHWYSINIALLRS